jgi:hypothetical protein
MRCVWQALVAVGLWVAWATAAHAQDSNAPLFPEPATPPAEESAAALGDGWPLRPAGAFAGVELFVPQATIRHLQTFRFPPGADNSPYGRTPLSSTEDLGWAVSPLVSLGYTFDRGNAVVASYRFLASDGRFTDSDSAQTSPEKVFLNIIDVDYQGAMHGSACFATFQWDIGLRLLNLVHDHPGWVDYSGPTHETVFGVGPHFGLNFAFYLGQTGVGAFARGDVGFQVGSGGWVGEIQGEVGLSWSPPRRRWLRFEVGYRENDYAWDYTYDFRGPFLGCQLGF